MRICMLSELFYPYVLGGAERRYYEIAKRLSKKHEVTVYSLKLSGEKNTEYKDGIEIRRVGLCHPPDRRSLPQLAGFFPAILKSVAGDYDIIDANQGVSSFAGALSPLTTKPVVATFHDIYWNQWQEYFPPYFSYVGKAMELLWSRLPYTRIMAMSPETEKKLMRLGFSAPIEVIPSGLDLDFIKSVKARSKGISAAYVGRLVKYKNVDRLIAVFSEIQKEYPDAELRIIGRGPEEHSLKALAKKLNVSAVFHGFVSETEKISIIKSSSVLVNPSSVEGLGLVLLESMACGTPVVARKLDTYFFCNNDNSILYTNQKEMQAALLDLLGNRKLVSRLARKGIETSARFSWDKTTDRVEKLYMEAIP